MTEQYIIDKNTCSVRRFDRKSSANTLLVSQAAYASVRHFPIVGLTVAYAHLDNRMTRLAIARRNRKHDLHVPERGEEIAVGRLAYPHSSYTCTRDEFDDYMECLVEEERELKATYWGHRCYLVHRRVATEIAKEMWVKQNGKER